MYSVHRDIIALGCIHTGAMVTVAMVTVASVDFAKSRLQIGLCDFSSLDSTRILFLSSFVPQERISSRLKFLLLIRKGALRSERSLLLIIRIQRDISRRLCGNSTRLPVGVARTIVSCLSQSLHWSEAVYGYCGGSEIVLDSRTAHEI